MIDYVPFSINCSSLICTTTNLMMNIFSYYTRSLLFFFFFFFAGKLVHTYLPYLAIAHSLLQNKQSRRDGLLVSCRPCFLTSVAAHHIACDFKVRTHVASPRYPHCLPARPRLCGGTTSNNRYIRRAAGASVKITVGPKNELTSTGSSELLASWMHGKHRELGVGHGGMEMRESEVWNNN